MSESKGEGRRSTADIVRATLEAVLPPGVPPSFSEIRGATRINKREIEASLTMTDGLPARVRLRQWDLGWSHQYVEMPGGALSFEDGQWRRVDDPQFDLFGASP